MLDAIDECEDESKVKQLFQTMLGTPMPGKFLVFLASRSDVGSTFGMDNEEGRNEVRTCDIEHFNVRQDIETYLRFGLSRIRADLNIASPIGKRWSEKKKLKRELASLAEDCGQSFIFAATALRFIGDDRIRNPAKRLGDLAGKFGSSEREDNPYSNLDKLYLHILRDTIPENINEGHAQRIRETIATVVLLRNRLPMNAFSKFLEREGQEVRDALYKLRSIIRVPGSDSDAEISSPRFFHPSFPDFIKNPQRRLESSYSSFYVGSEKEARMCLPMFGFDDDQRAR